MLAYRFPPANDAIASRRPEGLYRHLPEYGWEPLVVTTQNVSGLRNVFAVADNSLAARRQGGRGNAAGARSAGPTLRSRLSRAVKSVARASRYGYDAYARWSWDAARAAIKLGAEHPVDVVWATLSPLSLGPAALAVAKRLNVPCVLDLRDPPDEALGDLPRGWFTRALTHTNAVTVAAPSCITPYVAEHCRQPLLILSGAWSPDLLDPQPSSEFTILHAGTWHPNYEVASLLEALALLRREIPEFSDKARLVFLGRGTQHLEKQMQGSPARALIELRPPVAHAEAASQIQRASVLLIARGTDGYKSQAITGKIFEYAPYSIPLLSIGGQEDLHATLVRWLGGTWTSDPAAVAAVLRNAFRQWQAAGTVRAARNADALAYLRQFRMAAETATVLHEVVDHDQIPLRVETPWPAA